MFKEDSFFYLVRLYKTHLKKLRRFAARFCAYGAVRSEGSSASWALDPAGERGDDTGHIVLIKTLGGAVGIGGLADGQYGWLGARVVPLALIHAERPDDPVPAGGKSIVSSDVSPMDGSVEGLRKGCDYKIRTREVTLMAYGCRKGSYRVQSRWHEPNLRELLRQFNSPSLRWYYGAG